VITSVLFVGLNLADEGDVDAAFRRAGCLLVPCDGFASGRLALLERTHALAIVEAVLPDGAGVDLLASAADTPVVMLTEQIEVTERLVLLRAGVADCVGKPYDPLHLVARAISVLNWRKGLPAVASAGFARRILLVDDSVTYAEALGEELRRDGHDVAIARTANEALSFLAVQELDLAIVDAFLPDMSGIDLRSRMQGTQSLRRTPVLLLTGREKSALHGRAGAGDASEMAVKTRDLEAVRMQARRLLASEERGRPRSVPPPSSRSDGTPASHRSVPPSRRDGVPSSKRSVPPSRRDGVPSSKRSVPPPPSRRDAAPASPRSVPPSFREGPPSSHRIAPPSTQRSREAAAGEAREARRHSPLFEQVAIASGLSRMVGRPAVERACRRAGADPSRMTAADLQRALPAIGQVLRAFLSPEVAEQRLSEITRLARS
jgi:DNA-binding response OmpR family regulator